MTPLSLSNSLINFEIMPRLLMLEDFTVISIFVGDSVVADKKITERHKMSDIDIIFFILDIL